MAGILELTKTLRTDGSVEICAVVPASRAEDVANAIRETAEPNIPAREVFVDSTPGSRLRGARGLREMTQAGLAARIGVRASHISDMENNRRPIGRAMARKLAEALDFPYKAFL